MGLLPKYTARGQLNPKVKGLFNPMNVRHIILSIRQDYIKRLDRLYKKNLIGKSTARNCYKQIIKATQLAEQAGWKATKGSQLFIMIRDRKHIDKPAKDIKRRSMNRERRKVTTLHVKHKGTEYKIPIIKSEHDKMLLWGDNRIGFAMANMRTKGSHAKELKEFLE